MKPETRSFYELAVRRAAGRIADNLDSALELGALAREAALSPLHFHRVFRGMVGETPLELHRRLRMERAALALVTTDTPVTTLALDAGYETHEAFTRAFRQQYGLAPSAFRQAADGARAAPLRVELSARCGIHYRAEGAPLSSLELLGGPSRMQVDIKEMPNIRLGTVRHLGPYNRISEAFERLGAIAARAGLLAQPEPLMLAVYYDDPDATAPEELRSDAAISLPDGLAVPTGMTELLLRGGRYACTTHKGPYAGLGDAWSRFMGDWLPKSAHRVGDGLSFEIYRNTPMNAREEELLTEIYLPLAPA